MIDEKLTNCIKGCAIERYPLEMVGCVVGGKFVELKNLSHHPEERYILSARDKLMLFELGDSLQALVHSHPHLDNTPSGVDISASKGCGFPFWIVGTDGIRCTEILEVVNV